MLEGTQIYSEDALGHPIESVEIAFVSLLQVYLLPFEGRLFTAIGNVVIFSNNIQLFYP